MSRVEVLEYPEVEPVDYQYAVDFMRIPDQVQQPDIIFSLITSAREWVESYLGYKVSAHSLKVFFDGFSDSLVLPYANLVSVESVKYLDEDEQEQTLASSSYEIVNSSYEASIRAKSGVSWPTVSESTDSVYITYTAGFSPIGLDANGNVPARIKSAICMIASDLYTNRSSQTEKNLYENQAVERLLHPLRRLYL